MLMSNSLLQGQGPAPWAAMRSRLPFPTLLGSPTSPSFCAAATWLLGESFCVAALPPAPPLWFPVSWLCRRERSSSRSLLLHDDVFRSATGVARREWRTEWSWSAPTSSVRVLLLGTTWRSSRHTPVWIQDVVLEMKPPKLWLQEQYRLDSLFK